jgi:catechol 2,3-dioxygenase-like lactoylglutathione lyase family enzyme
VDMKLEVVVVPVADADRAKNFYKALGWREDADYIHEQETGRPDPDWPDWYAQYMVQEQAGRPGQAGPGAAT